jgi:hypothetical protein
MVLDMNIPSNYVRSKTINIKIEQDLGIYSKISSMGFPAGEYKCSYVPCTSCCLSSQKNMRK